MALKRDGQDDGQEMEARVDETPIIAQALRAGETVSPSVDKKHDDEKMSLFWRVFGGTILSIVSLIAITLFNNMMSSINDLRTEVAKANEARSNAVMDLRAEMAKSAEARNDLVRKEDYNSRMNAQSERVNSLQQQNNQQNALLTSTKTELDGMKERATKLSIESDGVKRDLATLELVKERLALLGADLKSMRDDHLKLRADADKNQAYDLERKQQRDNQYKQIDEAMKELQKAQQDCREKIARMEGPYGPPSPVATPPKKANSTRTAPAVEPRSVPEKAPLPSEPKAEPPANSAK